MAYAAGALAVVSTIVVPRWLAVTLTVVYGAGYLYIAINSAWTRGVQSVLDQLWPSYLALRETVRESLTHTDQGSAQSSGLDETVDDAVQEAEGALERAEASAAKTPDTHRTLTATTTAAWVVRRSAASPGRRSAIGCRCAGLISAVKRANPRMLYTPRCIWLAEHRST